MAANDPYYLVREEIQESVNKIQVGFEQWDRLPQSSESRSTIAQNLVSECECVISQLDEVDKTTDLAERDYARFRIEKTEITNRRSWNTTTRAQVDGLKASMASAARERKLQQAGRSSASKFDNAVIDQNDTFVNNQAEQHAMLIRRQDQDLDDLSDSVMRIGKVGLTISEELTEQDKLLTELEDDVDGTMTRLKAATKKLEQVIKKSGLGGQIAIIGCLLVRLVL